MIRSCWMAAATVLACPALAGPLAVPEFDLLWPALPKPFSFQNNFAAGPTSLAVDDDGYVYVAEYLGNRILKYSTDGVLVQTFGSDDPNADDFLSRPRGVAVDQDGNLYVTEALRSQLSKFDPDGNLLYLHTDTVNGSGDGQFGVSSASSASILLTVDPAGAVYVADGPNARVQKFTPEGVFDFAFGTPGNGEGQFGANGPLGVVWANERLYVSDPSNFRLQTFDAQGNFLAVLPDLDETTFPSRGLAADREGRIYIGSQGIFVFQVDADGNRLRQFGSETLIPPGVGLGPGEIAGIRDLGVTPGGEVFTVDRYGVVRFAPDTAALGRWSSAGYAPGQFIDPGGMDIDSQDRIYVAEFFNRRVQVFDADGIFLDSWSPNVNATGNEFYRDLTVAPDDSIYLINPSAAQVVRRHAADGTLLDSFGVIDADDPDVGTNGIFEAPIALTFSADGTRFVLDADRSEIQKFSPTGDYLSTFGPGPSDPSSPTLSDITTLKDGSGDLLVGDLFDDFVRRYDTDGNLLTSYTTQGGQRSLGVGAGGRFYVAYHNAGDPRLDAFDANGNSLGLIASAGTFPGQLGFAEAAAETSDGRVYVLDSNNNRVQRFRPPAGTGAARAIVVAGGGPYPGNTLWSATQANANFAVRTLVTQGFDKGSIRYLSADLDLDLDGNGLADDVDADATNANLGDAISGAFASGADALLIYLVDHGGLNSFRTNGNETLSATALDGLIDSWQAAHPGMPVTLIYDACQSGSFLDELAGADRTIVTSSTGSEPAYFVSQGTMSFSNHFWTSVFNGDDLRSAFDSASEAVNSAFTTQTPQLDLDGNGVGNQAADLGGAVGRVIGRGVAVLTDRPVIDAVDGPALIQSGNSATLSASGVFDSDGISRVWAVLQPPGYQPGSADNPVSELPLIELSPVDAIGNWSASYTEFNEVGTYVATVYAQDVPGNRSTPRQLSITVDDPLKRRAVLLVGPGADGSREPLFERLGRLAYGALAQQGYGPDGTRCVNAGCDDIHFLSTAAGVGFDAAPSLMNIEDAITQWGTDGVRDLTVYLIGAQDGAGDFLVSAGEALSASQLDSWLALAEATIPGQITVIYDGDGSGAFLPLIASSGTRPRIVLTGSAALGAALFSQAGSLSYSTFFWTSILNGASVAGAHNLAARSVRLASDADPQLDDQGNGVANELLDGLRARNYRLGNGILLAGDAPVVGGLAVAPALSADREPLEADPVTSTASVDEVLALITRPNGERVSEPLALNGSWTVDSVGLCGPAGDYRVAIVALDETGTASEALGVTSNRATACGDAAFDLAVTDVNAPTVALIADAMLEFSTVTRNLGAATQASANVTGYLSPDPVIDVGDMALGTFEVTELVSLEPKTLAFSVNLPTVESTVYLGACVESLAGDGDGGNDCSEARALRVVEADEIFDNSFETGSPAKGTFVDPP